MNRSWNNWSVGEMVMTPTIRNRWGIKCAATIIAISRNNIYLTVWNAFGPGANIKYKVDKNEVDKYLERK